MKKRLSAGNKLNIENPIKIIDEDIVYNNLKWSNFTFLRNVPEVYDEFIRKNAFSSFGDIIFNQDRGMYQKTSKIDKVFQDHQPVGEILKALNQKRYHFFQEQNDGISPKLFIKLFNKTMYQRYIENNKYAKFAQFPGYYNERIARITHCEYIKRTLNEKNLFEQMTKNGDENLIPFILFTGLKNRDNLHTWLGKNLFNLLKENSVFKNMLLIRTIDNKVHSDKIILQDKDYKEALLHLLSIMSKLPVTILDRYSVGGKTFENIGFKPRTIKTKNEYCNVIQDNKNNICLAIAKTKVLNFLVKNTNTYKEALELSKVIFNKFSVDSGTLNAINQKIQGDPEYSRFNELIFLSDIDHWNEDEGNQENGLRLNKFIEKVAEEIIPTKEKEKEKEKVKQRIEELIAEDEKRSLWSKKFSTKNEILFTMFLEKIVLESIFIDKKSFSLCPDYEKISSQNQQKPIETKIPAEIISREIKLKKNNFYSKGQSPFIFIAESLLAIKNHGISNENSDISSEEKKNMLRLFFKEYKKRFVETGIHSSYVDNRGWTPSMLITTVYPKEIYSFEENGISLSFNKENDKELEVKMLYLIEKRINVEFDKNVPKYTVENEDKYFAQLKKLRNILDKEILISFKDFFKKGQKFSIKTEKGNLFSNILSVSSQKQIDKIKRSLINSNCDLKYIDDLKNDVINNISLDDISDSWKIAFFQDIYDHLEINQKSTDEFNL